MQRDQAIIKAAQEIKRDPLALFDLIYFNNPNSLVNALRQQGLSTMVKPSTKEIEQIIKRLIFKNDFGTLQRIISGVAYNTSANNWTTSPLLWETINVPEGDYLNLFSIVMKQADHDGLTYPTKS